jgi:hypothetical protein
LEEFKGLKFITGIKKRGKVAQILEMKDKYGEAKSDLQDIANVFADCYEDFYSEQQCDNTATFEN